MGDTGAGSSLANTREGCTRAEAIVAVETGVSDAAREGFGTSVTIGVGLFSRFAATTANTVDVGVTVADMVTVGVTDAVIDGVGVGVPDGDGVEVADGDVVSVGSDVGDRRIATGTVTCATGRRVDIGGAAAWSQAGRTGVETLSTITPPCVGVGAVSPDPVGASR